MRHRERRRAVIRIASLEGMAFTDRFGGTGRAEGSGGQSLRVLVAGGGIRRRMADRTLHRRYEDPPVYSQEIVQVRADTTSKGRVVLAGEFNRHLGDLPTALATYEAKPRLLRLAMPMTRRAIGAFQAITALACRLHVPDLAAGLSKEDRGGTWQLPGNPARPALYESDRAVRTSTVAGALDLADLSTHRQPTALCGSVCVARQNAPYPLRHACVERLRVQAAGLGVLVARDLVALPGRAHIEAVTVVRPNACAPRKGVAASLSSAHGSPVRPRPRTRSSWPRRGSVKSSSALAVDHSDRLRCAPAVSYRLPERRGRRTGGRSAPNLTAFTRQAISGTAAVGTTSNRARTLPAAAGVVMPRISRAVSSAARAAARDRDGCRVWRRTVPVHPRQPPRCAHSSTRVSRMWPTALGHDMRLRVSPPGWGLRPAAVLLPVVGSRLYQRYQRALPPLGRATNPTSHTTSTMTAIHQRALSAKPAPKRIKASRRTRSRGTMIINLQATLCPASPPLLPGH